VRLCQIQNIENLRLKIYWLLPFFIIIPLCKNVYSPVLLISLIIPWKIGKLSKRDWKIMTIFALSSIASYSFWTYIVQSLISQVDPIEMIYGSEPGLPKINPSAQMNGILIAPIKFFEICITSIIKSSDLWYTSFIGLLGWLEIHFSNIYYHVTYAYLILLALLQGGNKLRLGFNASILFFIAIILTVLHFLIAMYLTWNNVGDSLITNFQGRYFSPVGYLLFIALAILSGRHNPVFSKWLVLSASIISFIYTSVTLYKHYYVNII
jgi:uncharacterized membrane protein